MRLTDDAGAVAKRACVADAVTLGHGARLGLRRAAVLALALALALALNHGSTRAPNNPVSYSTPTPALGSP